MNNNHVSISNYVVEKSGVFEERCGGTLSTAGMEDMDNSTGLGWQTLICCVVERNDNGMENVAGEVWLVAPGFGE